MEIIIRPTIVEDAKGINALRRMPGVFENIMGIPSERMQRNVDFIINMPEHTHMFSAVVQDETGLEMVVGTISLHVESNLRRRHVGAIGMMVHKDYQNKGIGTKLMEAALDIADNWLKLLRVELTVFADNAAAIHLYEKFGFVTEGKNVMAAIRNGKYEDLYMMARIVEAE